MNCKKNFIDYVSNINLQQYVKDELRDKYKILVERLKKEPIGEHIIASFLQGSVARDTATKSVKSDKADIDIVVVTDFVCTDDLNNKDTYKKTPEQALNAFRDFLNKYYSGKWRKQGRSLGIEMSNCCIDLVPTALPSPKMKAILREMFSDTENYTKDMLLESYGSDKLKNYAQSNSDWKSDYLMIPDTGDISVIDFEGFKDGVAFEGGKGENYELTIGSNQFIPGFEEQLIGMKTEEEKEINVTFPENYHVEDLKGKPVVFKVKLHEIKKKVLPELDEELIKDLKIENVNTLDELKDYYRTNLLNTKKNQAENKALDEVIDKLVEEAKIDVPEVMIKNMCDNMINEYGQQFMAQGISMEQFKQMFGGDVQGLRDAFKPEAEKRVKTSLCLNKIAELENLVVSDEDLEKFYTETAEKYSMKVEDVKKYIPQDSAKEDLKVEKALDFIKK